jgi:hypothetical protein
LLTKLKAKVNCKRIFDEVYDQYTLDRVHLE